MIALIVLMIIITCINPNFMTANNLLNLLLQVTANGFIAFGMTFVILTSGIDLSVGAILALSSAVSAGFIAQGPVSYTHLRAHETDSYLVCRLLLEKKKTKEVVK